jgi:hypothetical protein
MSHMITHLRLNLTNNSATSNREKMENGGDNGSGTVKYRRNETKLKQMKNLIGKL